MKAPTPALAPLAGVAPELSDRLFAQFRELIYQEAGIALTEGKQTLLVSRLAGRLRELRLESFEAYYRLVSDPGADDERQRLLDRICTNETRFFRDQRQWQFLEDTVFPRFEAGALARRSRTIRAWSAACSTGEEPYSLAMALLDRFPASAGWRVEVLGTDLSTKVLNAARTAIWPLDRSGEVPLRYRKAYMLRGTGSQAGRMRAGPEIRSVVSLARVNLHDPGDAVRGPFDLIFCRNVLIYFDLESKTRVVERLVGHLAPGGYLFMGYAETTSAISTSLEQVGPNVFARVGDAADERAVVS